MSHSNLYIQPELSLLSFNQRVLAMAQNKDIPLLERLKFLCIFSSNMDEFFEIRVAGLLQKAEGGVTSSGIEGFTPTSILQEISDRAHKLVTEQYRCLNNDLLPALEKENVRFLAGKQWNEKQQAWLKKFFKNEVLPVLTPIRLDPAHPFPLTINKGLCIIVDIKDSEKRDAHNLAIVPAPRVLPRFIRLPDEISDNEYEYVYLSEIIAAHISKLFPSIEILGCYQFRITRNSDLYVDAEEVEDLLRTLEGELPSRKYGQAVRIEVSKNCPKKVIKFLQDRFKLSEENVYAVDGPVNLNRLISLPDLVNKPNLKYSPFTASVPENLTGQNDIFDSISKGDILLHHPYESFTPVVDLIRQATRDPNVLVIKQTLYRTGDDSVILQHLMEAAKAGKEVTAVIELMARFDEETNISIAQRLQSAGAHVVYGMVGRKTHAKMLMIVRKERGKMKRYVHLGTGNYHQRNTRMYTDYGFFTANADITSDVHELFMQLTTQSPNPKLSKLVQSPNGIRDMLLENIKRETENANAGKPAHIIAKMNGLVSPQIIEALYTASQAGVKIDLIVRGMCCLAPGIKGTSETIHVRSVVGRFLEHGRIYYFLNGGEEAVYCASADWMPRNLINRIEQCTPIEDSSIKQRLIDDLNLYLSDNTNSWVMQSDGTYKLLKSRAESVNAQETLLEQFSEKN